MLQVFGRVFWLLLLLLALPLHAADRDKANAEAKVKAQLLEADYLEGKLTQVDASGEEKSFTLVVTAKTRVYNQANDAKAIDLEKKLAEMKRAVVGKRATPEQTADMRKRTEELKDLQSKVHTMQGVAYEFSLKAGKDLVVRQEKLPPKIGDDGKPGNYSPEELKKAKGDDADFPGWPATAKELKKDAVVRVWLDRKSVEFPSAAKEGYIARIILVKPSAAAKAKPLEK